MTRAELADYVCLKVGQTDEESLSACALFLRRRYQMIWDFALWKETLLNVPLISSAAGVCALPETCDQVVAVRNAQNINLPQLDLSTMAQSYPWNFNANASNLTGYIFLSPTCLPSDGIKFTILEPDSIFGPLLTEVVNLTRDFTLDESGLYTGDPETGFNPLDGVTPYIDKAFIVDPSDSIQYQYVYSTSVGLGTGWRRVGDGSTDYGGYTIASGTTFQIERRISPSFVWTLPNETNGSTARVRVLSSSANDTSQTVRVTGELADGSQVSENILLAGDGIVSGAIYFTNIQAVALSAITEGNVTVAHLGSATIYAGAINLNARPRIQLLGVSSAQNVTALAKRKFLDLLNDSDVPLLRNCENALLAFGSADMLERQRQYSKAAAKAEEGNGQLKILLDLERNQSANECRIIPAETGNAWGYYSEPGFDSAGGLYL